MAEPGATHRRPRRRGRAGAGRRGPRLATPRGVPARAAARAGGRLRRAPVPERLGQPDLPRPLRRPASSSCGGRRSASSRPVPTTCAASSGPSTRCRSTSTGRPRPTCSATTTTSSARTSSSSSTARGVVVWDHVPTSMAHHADAGRRIGFAVVDALADLHLLDPDEIGLGDLGRPTASSSGRSPGGASGGTSSTPGGCRR